MLVPAYPDEQTGVLTSHPRGVRTHFVGVSASLKF